MNNQSAKNRIAELRAEADRLEREAFENRPLPDKWRVGQKVRYLESKDWAWNKGDWGVVVGLREDEYKDRPAKEYQVFYTAIKGEYGYFWTTPMDVELIEGVAE